MRILSFALFCLFLSSSPVTAVYVFWGGDAPKKTELESNTNLVHCLEALMEKQDSHFTNFDALPNRYILAFKKGNQYSNFRNNYNATLKKTGTKYITTLFQRETLNTEKDDNDKTELKEYAYTISHATLGKTFSFYAIPRSQFYELKLYQEDIFTALFNNTPHVTFIGSCRVRLPLQALRNQDRIVIHNNTMPPSHYTASEAVQVLRIATGKLELPPENIRHLLWRGHELRPKPELDCSKTDIFVVESCSLREFVLDGYYLNNTEILNELFLKPLMVGDKSTTPLMPYYHHLIAEAEIKSGLIDPYKPRKKSTLNPVKLFNSLPKDFLTEEELYILTNLEVNVLTEEAFIQHMIDFSELAEGKPVIYVSHVNARGTDGNTIYSRELTDRYIQKGALDLDQYFFRPGDLFIDYAQKDVLVSRTDINHYKPEFMICVGEAILSIIKKAL